MFKLFKRTNYFQLQESPDICSHQLYTLLGLVIKVGSAETRLSDSINSGAEKPGLPSVGRPAFCFRWQVEIATHDLAPVGINQHVQHLDLERKWKQACSLPFLFLSLCLPHLCVCSSHPSRGKNTATVLVGPQLRTAPPPPALL